ncbi:MAG: Thiol-disulfide oxidoreductase ResA [Anaerolineales bacterium]|nr:Thiol-disulfide oxidoreductase ResA [Anaerolineales bacterium]
MDTDIEQLERTDETSGDEAIVVRISWVHVAVFLMVVVGIGGALAAGMWVGRTVSGSPRAPAVAGVQGPQAATARQQTFRVQPQQVAPIQPQPRVQAQPAAPRSSAGVTTSIGRTPSVGNAAPAFTLKNVEGERVSLSDFKGRPVLINFWATWCGPCRYEMPIIEEMYQKYQDKGFVVLAVDVEESITVVRSFANSMGLTFPLLLDYKGDVSDNIYRIRAFPTSYFIGRDGQITAMHRGMMNQQVMQRYMDQVLATQPIAGE